MTFNTPILGVIVDGPALKATHNALGATWHPTIKTAYGTRDDQGIETGDRIGITPEQNRLDFTFSGNADTDQIRIITAAPGGSTTVSAATDSATDASGALPADAVKVFPLDNNGAATTDQLTNQLYLPLVSR